MKNKIVTILALCICMSILFCSSIFAVDTPSSVAYEYPVKPGMAEWAEFITHEQMVNACQIPQNILEQATTNEIVNMILDHPLAYDIYAFNTIEEGVESLMSNSNLFGELLKRSDASTKLLECYAETPISKARGTVDMKKVLNITLLEGILSTDKYYGNLSRDSQKDFENVVKIKYEQRLNSEGIYGLCLSPYYEKLVSEQRSGISTYDTNTYVTTPNGSRVTVRVRSSELDASAITALNSQYDSAYPNAQRKQSASQKYNCHTYAWYSTTNRTYWMDDPSPYIDDGSYFAQFNPEAGYKVTYRSKSHSAVVNSTSINNVMVMSKWGSAGVYLHAVNYSPYDSSAVTYYERS